MVSHDLVSKQVLGHAALLGSLVLGIGGALAEVAPAEHPETWRLLHTKAGVRVYQEAAPTRALPRFRAVGVVAADLPAVLQVLRDVSAQAEWVPQCRQSTLLSAASATHMQVYQRYKVPWPLRDRDVVMDVQGETSGDGRRASIVVREVAAGMPQQKQVVRIPRLRGKYWLRQLSPGKTHVAYEVDVDLGGRLPDWFLRWVGKDVPYLTMEKLRKRLREVSAEAS